MARRINSDTRRFPGDAGAAGAPSALCSGSRRGGRSDAGDTSAVADREATAGGAEGLRGDRDPPAAWRWKRWWWGWREWRCVAGAGDDGGGGDDGVSATGGRLLRRSKRHSGHVPETLTSHGSTHGGWNWCWHGSTRTSSWRTKSSWQMPQLGVYSGMRGEEVVAVAAAAVVAGVASWLSGLLSGCG
jgi:hypothetical protein